MVYNNSNRFTRRNNNNNPRRRINQQSRKRAFRPRRQLQSSTTRRRNRSTTIGSWMRTAASSVISAIPGSSILKSVADFVFKAIKVSGFTVTDGFQAAEIATIGLNQTLLLRRVHFLINSPEITVLPGIPKNPNPILQKRHIQDRFIAYNMKEVTIQLKPQNDVGTRQGQWAMIFLPFISKDQEDALKLDFTNQYVGYNDILKMDGSVNGPQTQTLTINYVPQAHDGKAFWAAPSDETFGILIISYQDFAKPSKEDFTPQDFAATLLLSSTVRKLNRRANTYVNVSVEYESLITDVKEFVYNGNMMQAVMERPIREMSDMTIN